MDMFKGLFKSIGDTAAKMKRDPEVQKWLDEITRPRSAKRTGGKRPSESRNSTNRRLPRMTLPVSHLQHPLRQRRDPGPGSLQQRARPVVKRKVDRENPVAVAAAHILKATLTYLTDTGDQGETTFDDLQKTAVLEALVPGRGLARFAYDADVDQASMVTKSEKVCGDPVPWNRVVYGYAKVHAKIPWMAFEHFMTREECIENFGEKLGNSIKLTHAPADDKDQEGNEGGKGPADAEGVKFAHMWEIWDKRDKKVKFISEGMATFVEEREDKLNLDGFFPTPKPIQFINRVSSLVPQTLYLLYESQAKELEDVTRRIGSLTRAMKIRGLYDGTIEGLDDLLTREENTILPARNVAALQQGQTLDKSIWLMPLEKLISVLQQLYVNRQQIISVIHQLTGIADIMRGSSQASETLGAQKMKEAWGTMRLKRMQKEVQRFTRDCYRLQAELAAKHFSIETFISMTGVKLPRQAEQEQAQAGIQKLMMRRDELQAAAQSGQAQPEQLQQEAQQMQQQYQQFQQVMSVPSWEKVVQFLKDDSIRNYIIDIETNSTIDIEATEDKAELSEMMNSMSQLLNGVFPMVKEGVLPFQAAKALMLSVINKFRMGDEVEDTFRAMQEPPKQADPAQQKVQAEMQRDEQSFKLDQQAKQQELQQKGQIAQLELDIKKQELGFAQQELAMKMEFAQAKHKLDMETLMMKATMPPAAPKPAPTGA
jgi:hypothetical protein